MVACLQNIIGLDSTACDCFVGGQPIDYSVSTSGLYITEPGAGLPMRSDILASRDCSQNDIWAILDNARTLAIGHVERDLRTLLQTTHDKIGAQWKGVLFRQEISDRPTLSSLYAGQIIKPRHGERLPHRQFVVTAIWAGFMATGTTNVTVNSNCYDWADTQISVNHTANKWTRNQLDDALTLELFDTSQPELYYAFTFDANGVQCLSARLWCCGGPPWGRQVNVTGFQENDLSKLQDYNLSGNNALGIALEGYFACDDLAWICDLQSLRMEDNYYMIAKAVQMKAVYILLAQMLDSGAITQYTLMSGQQGAARMAELQQDYADTLRYIAQNLPNGVSGCFGCKKTDFRTGKILM